MTDQQVEIWRKEFESSLSAQAIQRDAKNPDRYWNDPVQYHWKGFLMAKRNQPVIELPDPFKINNGDDNDETQMHFCADEVEQAITAAGYQYKVKE